MKRVMGAGLLVLGMPAVAAAALPQVSFQQTQVTVMENDAPRDLVVELSAPSTQAIDVPFSVVRKTARAGDFSLPASPLHFAAGVTRQRLTFTPSDDARSEADEIVVIALGKPANARLGDTPRLLVTLADDDRPPLGANTASPLGTNLAPVTDFTAEYPFANYFKQARPWISGNSQTGTFDDGRAIAQDRDGYVTQLAADQVARTVLFTGLPRDPGLNGKRLVLRYAGDGDFAYQGAALLSHAPGRDVIRLGTGGSGDEATVIINLVRTNPADPVRNVRLTEPGGICRFKPLVQVAAAADCPRGDFVAFEDATGGGEILFNPQFLQGVKRYRSLRFMDWLRTNDSTLVDFADRPRPGAAFWSTADGVPLEAVAALANVLDADPWVNVPHRAADNYVRQMAVLLREQLEPARRLHVEYSNETWNGIFVQSAFVQDQGEALGLDQPENNRFIGGLRFYSQRAQRIFDLYADVFGSRLADRVVRVMATQAVNPFLTQTILEFDQAAAKCDAFAIAPYFGDTITESARATQLKSAGVDGVFSWLTTGSPDLGFGSLADLDAAVADQQATVAGFGIPLISYEGGQHFLAAGAVQFDDALNALMDAVNRDPRMKDVYLTYLGNWRSRTGSVFWHYLNTDHWSVFGRWGSREFPSQPRAQAPKFDGLQTYIDSQPLP